MRKVAARGAPHPWQARYFRSGRPAHATVARRPSPIVRHASSAAVVSLTDGFAI